MKPEEKARVHIDELLVASGWAVQNLTDLNINASLGIAVREFPLESGPTDYLLIVGGKAVGVIEAKPEGTTLIGIEIQSKKYLSSVPKYVPSVQIPLPFAYETTGIETRFTDFRDPDPRSRPLYAFHKPETLHYWLSRPDTLRARLRKMPIEFPLNESGLRTCQTEAIKNLEKSFARNKPRSLIQMATGSGKTYTAVSFAYRLIKYANAKRVLFLVDRNNLGRQTLKEFQQYRTPDDGRKFTELYNVQHMRSNLLDPVTKVCITTIQRLYSMLSGEEYFEEENEEASLFNLPPVSEKPKVVPYNPSLPIETFDFIVTDECHRSIYHLWKQVLEYFDSFIIGLTATPSKQTLGFFHQNLVMEYDHESAIADGVNVGYEVYRIRTEITEKGSKVEAGNWIDRRNRLTRKMRWQQLDENLEYKPNQLDRDVVAKDQIRTIIKTFKEHLFDDIFPGRTEVPKTLVFAKDDSHAEDIVEIIREEFEKGNDFCKKITYRTVGEKPEDLIASFRNSYNPRIAVTVDMISTGTDIKPLECLLFMRDVKSRVYFEQMKGRGTRTINKDDFNAITPDARNKTHFVIVDAVGVCETDKTESHSLERKKGIPFDKLMLSVALGNKDEDTITSLAGRLARMGREISGSDRKEIEEASGGKPFKELVSQLFIAFNPDKRIEKAQEIYKTNNPSLEQIKKAEEQLVKIACEPLINPKLRNTIIDIKRRNEQTIDEISIDRVQYVGPDAHAKERSKTIIENFKKFIDENKDEITALQIIYSKPYHKRHITYEDIKKLAQAIGKPPYSLDTETLWNAYEQLQKSKVRRAGPTRLLTDIISLIRFATGQHKLLEPFHESVDEKFKEWIAKQERLGRKFTKEQSDWLTMIKDHISASISIEIDDFELSPFYEKGGPIKVQQLFGDGLNLLMNELNEALIL